MSDSGEKSIRINIKESKAIYDLTVTQVYDLTKSFVLHQL